MAGRRRPPLEALRVFEAAARNSSFTRAGEELGLTQSAVSKRVADLETHLGRRLFERGHRHVVLTPEGRHAADAIAKALGELSGALSELAGRPRETVRIVAEADFAQLWLFPRLAEFQRRRPDLSITLRSETDLARLPEEGWDLALLYGRGGWRGVLFEPLFTNSVFPVVAPELMRMGDAEARDLSAWTLIHDRTRDWWQAVVAALGATGADPMAGPVYGQTVLCLEAAARGDGATIGDEVTTWQYLRDGRLVAPFSVRLPSPDAYYMIRPLGAERAAAVEALRVWLLDEANRHRLWFAGRDAVNGACVATGH